MYEITKRFTFEAAHVLSWHEGKCKRTHGHSYKLEVTIASRELTEKGVVMDFGELSKIVDSEIISKYDHQLLNEFFLNPTAELMAREIFGSLETYFYKAVLKPTIVRVKLWETENCSVTINQK